MHWYYYYPGLVYPRVHLALLERLARLPVPRARAKVYSIIVIIVHISVQ